MTTPTTDSSPLMVTITVIMSPCHSLALPFVSDTAEHTPTDTAEHTPTDTAEHTPTDTAEHTPTDTAEHTPTDDQHKSRPLVSLLDSISELTTLILFVSFRALGRTLCHQFFSSLSDNRICHVMQYFQTLVLSGLMCRQLEQCIVE